MIAHEEAAKKVHPSARHFRPVKRMFRGLIGWTFEIDAGNPNPHKRVRYSWVTADGQVSSDCQTFRTDAARILCTYAHYNSPRVVGGQSK